MSENTKQDEALEELRVVMAELASPQAEGEVLTYLEEVTAEAAREHELVLTRSQKLAGIPLFP